MPVELNITESVTSLDTTVVQVTLESASEPGPAGPGVPTGGTDGQVLTKTSGTDYATAWEDPTGGGGGAPDDADYLVGTASGDLSAEIVVGTSPGGELGGTWASPTVDATHSGSSHAAVQAAAEATAAAALSAHDADTTGVHGIADTSALALTASHPTNATFNDHSARHEDGGADEISIAGLSGTPAALTTHEADTTAVHGIADTSLLALTSAHPTNATFNDHSARHENGGADEISLAGLDGTPTELTNHLTDAADAHDASAISVLDTAGDYTATDVEGVLAEIAPQLGGGTPDAADVTIADAGSFYTGTDVEDALQELGPMAGWTEIVKGGDESVANTTLQQDDHLTFATVAGGVYEVEGTLIYSNAAGGAPDFKIAFGEDATARGQFKTFGVNASDAASEGNILANQTASAIHGSAVGNRTVAILGTIVGNGGTFALLWAQGTSNATATILKTGSVIRYRRIL